MAKTRVVVVDDSALVREHVAWALAQHAQGAAQVVPR